MFPQAENSLYTRFLQECNRHTPISGDILKENITFFYKQIMKKHDFQASEDWLRYLKDILEFVSLYGCCDVC